jgi:iron complex transport system substrate-binding protein
MTTTIGNPQTAPALPSLPEIDDVTRREFLIGAAGLLLLPAGCGSGGEDRGGPPGETRAVEHALGTARVPVEPRRVVVMDPYASLQSALAVGSPVVASPVFPDEPFPDFLSEEKTSGIEGLDYDQPSIEKIAALDPDLIVGWVDWIEYLEAYDDLSEIAPTVAARSSYDWKENSLVIAGALNRRKRMEALISDYEARVGELKGRLGPKSGRPEVSVVKPREDVLEVYTNRFYAGRILEEAGVRRPENQVVDDPEKTSLELSLEFIPDADADVIFLMVGGGGEDERAARESLRRFESSPLWKRLRAVRNDRVHEVDPDAWFITSGPQAANVVLDDLSEHLLEGG